MYAKKILEPKFYSQDPAMYLMAMINEQRVKDPPRPIYWSRRRL